MPPAMHPLEELKERQLFAQCSNFEQVNSKLARGEVTLYIGIDPTLDSLHAGHLLPLLLIMRLLERGNRAIIIIGDGTAKIGDPSGKRHMRKLISPESIDANGGAIQAQVEKIFARRGHATSKTSADGAKGSVEFVRNGTWLDSLGYIDFLREIGSHFSVNHMLTFETYRRRLEEQQGLSFIEFNYTLLQAYDFLMLYSRHNCTLQVGGDDQWGNIVAGIDLIRRVKRGAGYALTAPLVVTSTGEKMGKTNSGAVFLDADKTSVFDFYQYWRNISDADLRDTLLRYTWCSTEEIDTYTGGTAGDGVGARNDGKIKLAHELTNLVHGSEAAESAGAAARALFAPGGGTGGSGGGADIPSLPIEAARVAGGVPVIDLFAETPLCGSKSEARRLVTQGGAQVNGRRVESVDTVIDNEWLEDSRLLLKAGKKRVCQLRVAE